MSDVHKQKLTASRARELIFYDMETGKLSWKVKKGSVNPGDKAGARHCRGYLCTVIDRVPYLNHRLAWLIVTGDWPSKQIDHINMVKTDNRWSNLREATNSENHLNASVRSDNTSGYRGVSFCKKENKWRARCNINKKEYNIGMFKTAEEAAKAYDSFAIKMHGEFYRPLS